MSLNSGILLVAAMMLFHQYEKVNSLGYGDIQGYANMANDAIGVLKGDLPIEALLLGSTGPTLDKILGSVDEIVGTLERVEASNKRVERKLNDMGNLLQTILTQLPFEGKLDRSFRELTSYVRRVDFLYKNFLHDDDLPAVLNKMHYLFVPDRSANYADSLVLLAGKKIRQIPNHCSTGRSSMTKLYELYDAVAISETRGFVMTIFAYALLSLLKKSQFFSELDAARDDLVSRTDDLLVVFAEGMEDLSSNIELCDAREYKSGVNYVELAKSLFESSVEDRGISLAPQMANIKKNKVVTGLRFVMKRGMLHIQIQESTLAPNGRINGLGAWVKVPKFKFAKDPAPAGTFVDAKNKPLGDEDYEIIWYTMNRMYIDELHLPFGYVLTGVRFNHAKGNKRTVFPAFDPDEIIPIRLELHGTKFDFGEGKLSQGESMWVNSNTAGAHGELTDYDEPRSELPLDNEKFSELSESNHEDSHPNQEFQFSPASGMSSAHTVPVFDSRPVVGNPAYALTGVSLYHRGQDEYGGYLNFRIFNVDVPNYVNDFPKRQEKQDSEEDSNKSENDSSAESKELDSRYS